VGFYYGSYLGSNKIYEITFKVEKRIP